MSVVIGIDPGKNGGLAAMRQDVVNVIPMPIAGKELDIARICDWLYQSARGDSKTIVVMEKVHSMSQQGVASTFTFGVNVGILYGIIGALLLPLYLVAPQTWKKAVLADTAKDKQAAIDYCVRVYPNVSLLATPRSKKLHDGMADALCIARYGLERYKDVL